MAGYVLDTYRDADMTLVGLWDRLPETRLSERHELEKPERLDGVGLFTVLDLELK